jgi:rhodanese-related sulfurtransferase
LPALTSVPLDAWQHRGVTTPMHDQVPGVPPEDLPVEFPAGGAVLLDVREDNEWTAGHAPGAVHIPMGQIPQRLGDIPEADRVYVVCRSGGRSARVTAYLNANGWDAVNVERGMNGWSALGRPMESADPDTAPYVL